jgi:small subunit ribosomal protein S17
MDKTVVVAIETKKVHPLYKKAVKVTKKYKAHDENNDCKIGDTVKIIETRPLSREKRWRVIEVISKREAAATKP